MTDMVKNQEAQCCECSVTGAQFKIRLERKPLYHS